MKEERHLKKDFKDIKSRYDLDRRDFLKYMAGGIVVAFTIGGNELLAQRSMPSDFNAYLLIEEDGNVKCFTGKIEMGQGVITSLAQMLADELDVSLGNVEMIMGDTDLCPWDMGTFGSMSTRFFGPPLRAAGAEARATIIELAARRLQLPADQLQTRDGVVYDIKNGENRVSYAEISKGQKIARVLDQKTPVKNPPELKLMGSAALRTDAFEKVTGQARFAGDIQPPGMLYARILRPPSHNSKLTGVDLSAVEDIEGLEVVHDGDFIAVLHESPDVAAEAIVKVTATYDTPGSDLNEETIFQHLLKVAPEGEIVAQNGDLNRGGEESDIIIEKEYLDGYVAHAPIEPHTATVVIEDGKATVWASTQTPFRAKEEVADILDLPSENVRVKPVFVGGGFGGKSVNRQAVEAARLAKLTGKPVQVAWTREEEFFYDTFRPAGVVKIRSGMKESGKFTLWDYGVFCAGERGSQQFYDFPHHATKVHGPGWSGSSSSHPLAVGAWRAPANNTNSFARESQIDIMASKAGMDPLKFRLMNLKDKKMIRVLETIGEKFGPTDKLQGGHGVGLACGIDAGTYVALMAEVNIDKKRGKVQILRVVCVQDMGLVINPEGAKLQIEGCITMGMGYALSEDVKFEGGMVHTRNFDTYEIPGFSWIPKIESVFIDAKDDPPQGGGEPAIICMGAVIANAIFNATGARLLQLPMTPERVLEAINRSGES
ncbi:MAG TPA: molybdopterin cofactor-binding domain-containing protein [Bacteroidales bacterium]|nr:molybdopterin cofactor-binding domain-containing protein [Bacteroidales bacterium]